MGMVEEGYPVESCPSENMTASCELLFSLPICLIVILCNMIKAICMFLSAKEDRSEKFLTTGDAISSFLTQLDMTTKSRCLTSGLGRRRKSPWTEYSEVLPKRKDGLVLRAYAVGL